ncbi:MAG: hypothetical protein R3C40_11675 [Parvularculaceae bacterium]
MILRRVIDHVKAQAWTAVFLDFVIVVAGVFIGIQVSNWNDERAAYGRREQVKATLLTDLHDASAVTHDGIYLPVLQGIGDHGGVRPRRAAAAIFFPDRGSTRRWRHGTHCSRNRLPNCLIP